jgi:hypothetical protein
MVGLCTGRLPFLDRGDVSLVLEILPEGHLSSLLSIFETCNEDASKIKKSLKAEKRNLACALDVG